MASLTQAITFNATVTHQVPVLTTSIQKPTSLNEFCKQGNLKEAFTSLATEIFTNDQAKCLDKAYSLVLDLCASQKALSQGKQIHAQILKSDYVYDKLFLDTKLVFLYGKCGSLLYAENVFDKMVERSIFTYNALLGAYVSSGEPREALELYAQMRFLDVPLDAYSFPCVLKACGGIGDWYCGREIHGFAVKLGFLSNAVVVNSLVDMYAKCNDLYGAVFLFARNSDGGDVVLWNSMISMYSANGMYLEALRVFCGMLDCDITPSTFTFVAALQACGESVLRACGMEIHAAIVKSGLCYDRYVVNALIVMYSKCCWIYEAAQVFGFTDERDNVTWNSMLSGYVQKGLYYEAFDLFREMRSAGVEPDCVSIMSMISACGRLGNQLSGMEIHAFALKNGMDCDLQVGNSIMDMYAKCGRISHMNSVFQRMPCKDSISWTTVIAGCAQNNCHIQALQLFKEVLAEGMKVDKVMIGSILLCCNGLKNKKLAKEIHGYIIRRELSDLVLHNSLLDVYGECGSVDYSYNIFKAIIVKNVVSWTSMISCFVHYGLANEALELFHSMIKADVEPDIITMFSVLSAAASLSALRKGKEIHGYLFRKFLGLEGSITSSLIDMYASCGCLASANKVFSCVKEKDIVLWTSMINAYGMHGHGQAAINLFETMIDENILPDHITFLALLYACSHSALVDEGKRFFEIMVCQYKLDPWPEHHACMVDLLGRANCLEEAYQIVKSMRMQPTPAIWCALLGACRIHFNKEIGEIAARNLLDMDPQNPGNYVLVSNTYAATSRWEDVYDVRNRMKEKGLKKDPACSWMEVGNKVHVFTARDRSHPESERIHEKLADITEKLERDGGYVAQTKYVLHNVEEKQKVKMLHEHSERLAIAYGLLITPEAKRAIRITKNLRVCGDCHTFSKLVSKFYGREIIVRDANRFHHFKDGVCSCGDFW